MHKALESIFNSGKKIVVFNQHTQIRHQEKEMHIIRQHEFINVHLNLCMSSISERPESFHLTDAKWLNQTSVHKICWIKQYEQSNSKNLFLQKRTWIFSYKDKLVN